MELLHSCIFCSLYIFSFPLNFADFNHFSKLLYISNKWLFSHLYFIHFNHCTWRNFYLKFAHFNHVISSFFAYFLQEEQSRQNGNKKITYLKFSFYNLEKKTDNICCIKRRLQCTHFVQQTSCSLNNRKVTFSFHLPVTCILLILLKKPPYAVRVLQPNCLTVRTKESYNASCSQCTITIMNVFILHKCCLIWSYLM